MSLELQMAIEGNLTAFMQAQAKGVARAVTGAVRVTTFGLQRDIKRQLKRAKFAKPGLENLVKSKVNPKRGYLPDAEGLVYTRAAVKRRSGVVDLVEAYDQGAVIAAGSGHWLAIPTDKAPTGRSGRKAAEPRNSGLDLAFEPTRNPNLARLVLKRDRKIVVYWLVRQVTVRKRISIDDAKNRWLPKLEPKINKNLDRISDQIGVPL